MDLKNVINDDLIFLNETFNDSSELFDFVAGESTKLGLSKDTYAQALKDREIEFPTGLQLENYGVAIPHSDSVHINEEFIAVVTLKEPVEFKSMEDPDQSVETRLVFVLGLTKAEDQLSTLQTIIQLIQDESALEGILGAETKEELLNKL
ncbi:PTS sugar transporter subunit IIA [Hutsoniella sourekii]|uniref:PTS sugar transporter subunit IIA n=1 Tax=Hutsoniella sourekii TaxID=87650 RepID=UPI00048002DB|nr:PTS sugar transporter subunit IIA [Hutsoniella sourekii]